MKRRDFVKAMLAASVTAKTMLGQQAATSVAPSAPPPTAAAAPAAPTAPGPVPWMRGLMDVKPLPMTPLVADAVAQTNAHFFKDQQIATLRRLCEILLPPLNGHPGAVDVGAPEFLDFLIGVSPVDRQQMYQSGLDRLNAEARKKFGVPFAQVQTAQAEQLLQPWLRTWMEDHPPTDPYAHFINIAHSDIRTATVNSQAWSEAANAAKQSTPDVGLYWFPVEPDVHREEYAPVRRPARGQRPS
ncbi:MAG: gluconate 2-dehydrogenase subunit 3 family protein [Silvibacterium sp.]